ncbi:Acyltransferase family protein [compost metagenome]
MKPRDAYFDNLKWLLVLLVVVGHLIEPLPNNTALQPLYLTIYTFHIPLFVMVSGYFSKQLDNSKYTTRVISQLVVPYFIFESLYSLFDYAVLGLFHTLLAYVVFLQHDHLEGGTAICHQAEVCTSTINCYCGACRLCGGCRILCEYLADTRVFSFFSGRLLVG